jgi:hypothetical protein
MIRPKQGINQWMIRYKPCESHFHPGQGGANAKKATPLAGTTF